MVRLPGPASEWFFSRERGATHDRRFDMKLGDTPSETLKTMRFRHSSGILTTEIDGESIILDLASGHYSSFNPVGSLIWRELSEESHFHRIIDAVVTAFDVDEEVARKELIDFLDQLLTRDMIIVVKADEST